MSFVKSVLSVSAMTLLSRIMGFIRDIFMASALGASPLADAFFVAFRLPNMFRSLLAEGAFNNAFVPIFSKKIAGDGKQPARKFGGQVVMLMVLLAIGITAVFVYFMPAVIGVLAHGYVGTPFFDVVVHTARILFPYLIFVMVMAQISGMLNSVKKFTGAAFAPVLLNVGMIGALLLIMQNKGDRELVVADLDMLTYGVLLSGAVQAFWVILCAKRAGILPILQMPKITADIKRLFTVMIPGILGSGVYHINIVFSTMFATMVGAGSVSYLVYAERLFQLPVGLIGVAISVVLLPSLSQQITTGDGTKAMHTQNRALEMGALLCLPAAGAMMVMAFELIGGLFMRDAFTEKDAERTAAVLSLMAVGVPAYVFLKILIPSFFARHDTRTPVIFSAIAVTVNIILAWYWLDSLALVGIVLAGVLSAWLNLGLVAVTLYLQNLWRPDRALLIRLLKIILCTAVMMGAVVYTPTVLQSPSLLLTMVVQIMVGKLVYMICILGSQTFTMGQIKSLLVKSE